jgi:DNA-binding NtrC family response regulator
MTDSSRISLLIVDDEPDMLRGLQRILKIRGFDVVTANSGEQAIEEARRNAPQGILMDIRMPGIDGVEAYRRIREITPNAFVVFMTAFTTLMDEAKSEGAVKVLSKPLDLDDVCAVIENAVVTRPVLVVDDDPDFLQSLSRAIQSHGLEVHRAREMSGAIAIFEKRPRAVVLLDMKLNGDNGLEVLRQLKRRNPDAVVLQMSGYPELQPEIEQGLSLGAHAHFMKPFDVERLMETLRRVMRDPRQPDRAEPPS